MTGRARPGAAAGTQGGECPGRNPGALGTPDSLQPVAGRVARTMGRTGCKRAGVRKGFWRPRSRRRDQPTSRSRTTTEGGAQPAPKTQTEPTAKARLQSYGSRAPAQRRPPLHLTRAGKPRGCIAMPQTIGCGRFLIHCDRSHVSSLTAQPLGRGTAKRWRGKRPIGKLRALTAPSDPASAVARPEAGPRSSAIADRPSGR